ncbi:MAG: MOSC domain-containing protein [Proteobacteria bacterium]|nr:MOSC domain-containing protein [Pseudomonadota bacterium]
MSASISEIHIYPVKGLSGLDLAQATLEKGQAIAGDRRFALGRPGFVFDTENPVWMPKTNFLALVRDEKLAELDAGFNAVTNILTLRQGGCIVLAADISGAEGRTAIEAFFAEFLAGEIDGTPTFLEAGDHSFSDFDAKVISLINLDSVAALGSEIDTDIDARRFRANIYFEGQAAWTEFDWLDRKIRIGTAVAEVIKRTRRCAATNVNPDTATRDLNLPRALQKGWGHTDMGVYARVVEPGEIRPGDPIVPIS